MTRIKPITLSDARINLAATTVGGYAFFGGGDDANNSANPTVDVYYLSVNFTLFKNSKYKFQNISEEVTVNSDMETISIPMPVTGYIKFKNTTIS